MNNKNITILLPAYNPTEELIDLTNNLINNNFNVIVVNDGSDKENSQKIFRKLNKSTIILRHLYNQGKGQALKTGFRYIFDNIECDGVVTADADGQHLIKDIINVANELKNNSDSLILGSRKQNKDMMFVRRFGNNITKLIFKFVTGTSVYDTQTGLRGIPFKYLNDLIHIDGNRYEYEMNMLKYCINEKIEIKEITIDTVYLNNNSSSNLKLIRDTIKIYKCMLKDSNFLSMMLFGISAILSFGIDFILLLLLNNLTKNLYSENISLLLSVVGARIVSSLFNFTFNRNIVFKDKKNLLKSFIEYYLLAAFVIIANYLLLNLLTVKLSLNLAISKIGVEVVLFICNYLIQKMFIFKKKSN